MTIDPELTTDPQVYYLSERLKSSSSRRVGWSVLDQGLSSLSNFALAVGMARFVSAPDFGASGIAIAAYLLLLAVSRSLTSEPFLVRYATADRRTFVSHGGAAAGTSSAVGLVGAAVLAGVAVVLGGRVAGPMFAIAAVLPFILVQDMWRYMLIARGDARSASANDGLWVALQLLATGVLVAQGDYAHLPAAWILVWGGCGAAAAFVGALQCGAIPGLTKIVAWCRSEGDMMWRFLLETLVTFGSAPITLFVLGAVSGLDAVASIRGAQAVFGPFFVVCGGVMIALIPEGVRMIDVDPGRFKKILASATGGLALVSVAMTMGLLLLPVSFGRGILGASWLGTHRIVLAYGLAMTGGGIALGAVTGLRALQAISTSLRCRLQAAPAMFVLPIVGALLHDTVGFAVGVLAGSAFQVVFCWLGFAQEMSAHRVVPAHK